MSSFRANHPAVKDPDRCRRLRRHATDAEDGLWRMLRGRRLLGAKFRRQHDFGPHVLDFFCPDAGLVVEADGGQHFLPDGVVKDEIRTRFLSDQGLRVLRFTDREILLEPAAVQAQIAFALAGMSD